uniref:C-type lectin domain-containing protein n=1 Tax=Chrysemys picta bellii TaxID=8478 RepID=A0A8C3FSR7_CHRPI
MFFFPQKMKADTTRDHFCFVKKTIFYLKKKVSMDNFQPAPVTISVLTVYFRNDIYTFSAEWQVWTCCPMGWKHFQSSCYYFSIDTMNWSDSETNCTGMSSHLVVINTGTEQDFILNWIKRTVTSFQNKNYYIGLTDQAQEGQWHWVDQTPYNETAAFWRQGEPSNSKMENCAVMHAETNANRKNWNDIPCSTKVNRICETDATRF